VTIAAEGVEREYVAARTVLLDALDALLPHRPALVVVGAQAVYARTGSAGLTVAPYTTDGDVAVNPQLLGDDPLLESVMRSADFDLQTNAGGGVEPGTWVKETVVDGMFRGPSAPGVVMAARAVRLDVPEARVVAQLVGYFRDLLAGLAG
jgi:hypothetical protein